MKSISYFFLSGVLLFCSLSEACFQKPSGFQGGLSEGVKEVFLFHDGSFAHMVVRTQLTAEKFPKNVAWVLPLPSMPTKYEEIDGPLFSELNDLFPPPPGSFGGRGSEKGSIGGSGIKVHSQITVGQFTVQPIEITKDGSAQELNQWLEKNKFEKLSEVGQQSYLKKGAAFLVIRMDMNRANEAALVSRPLHITYPAKEVFYPLKSHHAGWKFDFDLYVFSRKELKKDLTALGLSNKGSSPYENKHLRPFIDHLIPAKSGYLTKYSGQELNSQLAPVSALPTDPTFGKTELY